MGRLLRVGFTPDMRGHQYERNNWEQPSSLLKLGAREGGYPTRNRCGSKRLYESMVDLSSPESNHEKYRRNKHPAKKQEQDDATCLPSEY
jgi:hypothetical protein